MDRNRKILISILALLVLSLVLLPAFPMVLKGIIPANLIITTQLSTIFIAMGMGMVGSLIFCLPVFHHLFGISPMMLLRDSRQKQSLTTGRQVFRFLSFVPAIACFLFLAYLLMICFIFLDMNCLRTWLLFRILLMN